jgi:hypothetical protein
MLFNIDIVESSDPKAQAQSMVTGLEKLGNGCFATAYASGKDQVIKVSVGNDWGYMSFLEAMQQMPAQNPWFPRIHWVRVFMDESGLSDNNRIVTCLERLDRPWESSGFVDKFTDPNAALWTEYVTICKEIEAHMDRPATRQQDWIMNNAELMDALKVVKRAMKMSDRGTDMHCGNFMVRGRQLVITDPIGY